MSAQAAILALLQASSGLVALVGDRIYPDQLPETPQFPALTFRKVGGGGKRGATSNPGLMHASVQVSVWARSRPETVAMVTQVRKGLDRKRKIIAGGVPVDDCFYESDVDLDDIEDQVYYTHIDFSIHYRDTP